MCIGGDEVATTARNGSDDSNWSNEEICPFPGGTRTLIGTATVNVTDQVLTTLTIPITGTVRALSELAVEIAIPNRVPQGDIFFAGSNAAGQTAPSYISSVQCGLPEPVDMAAIGFRTSTSSCG